MGDLESERRRPGDAGLAVGQRREVIFFRQVDLRRLEIDGDRPYFDPTR